MKLAKKKTFDDWIDVGDNVELLIDYPTLAQNKELQKYSLKNAKVLSSATEDDIEGSWETIEYMRLYLKYTIKDWRETKDGKVYDYMFDGLEPFKCELHNNELDPKLLEILTDDIEQTGVLFGKVYSELEVTEGDQKK